MFFPFVHKNSIFELDDLLSNSGGGGNSAQVVAKNGKGSGKNSSSGGGGAVVTTAVTTTSSVSVLAAGKDSTMALYNLGTVVVSRDASAVTVSSVRESAVNLLSKSVMSFYNSFMSGDGNNNSNSATNSSSNAATVNTTVSEHKTDAVRVQDAALIVAPRMEFRDSKRRVLKLSVDPSGSLIAAADALGRVTLFDTHICAVVRIWKGLRQAELAWTSRHRSAIAAGGSGGSGGGGRSGGAFTPNSRGTSSNGSGNVYEGNFADTPENGSALIPAESMLGGAPHPTAALNLVIHAPLLGLVYMYAMPHGACVRIVPVGMNCHIFSLAEPSTTAAITMNKNAFGMPQR